MTADPIRDALREATRDINGRMADRGYEVPWPEDGRLIAAAAVVAFNRRIAEHFRERGRINDLATAIELEDIAAAVVERAAKEGA